MGKPIEHIYWSEVRNYVKDTPHGKGTHNLLIGETNTGKREEIEYRKSSIISKKIAVWRIKLLLKCY